MTRRVSFAWLCGLFVLVSLSRQAAFAQYEAPTTYYNSATGTGATLKTQLRTIVSTMTGVTYGDARFSAPYTDPDPNDSGNILLIYNRASIDGAWNNTTLPWNREHIWPESRLFASASNGTANVASDQFNLRPANPGINSNRGNSAFGNDTATGGYGYRGSLWYPGDADAGDVARSQFYMATRYSQLSLVDTTPSGTQMGDLSALVNFHYRDVPDAFEQRRNHAIYGLAGASGSPAITNPYRQQNRNPYVDHPEFVWSVFVDQQNDSQLYVGGAPSADGSSTHNLNLGSVLVGAAVSAAQNVMLNKNGLDGTYFEVTTSGAATSSISGRNNAFQVLTSGTDSRALTVGLDTNTATAGLRSGTVTINNLDITTDGGAGRGNNDGNDTIDVSLNVLSHANPSFTLASDENVLNLDFGTVTMGSVVPAFEFEISNLIETAGFTAGLDLDSIVSAGDVSALTTSLTAFSSLAAGSTNSFLASIDTSAEGTFSASYTLNFSDEDLPGATGLGAMTLTLSGIVEAAAVETGDFDGDGDIDGRDFLVWQRGESFDPFSSSDLELWQAEYDAPPVVASVAVPEPSSVLCLLVLAGLSGSSRRRSSLSL